MSSSNKLHPIYVALDAHQYSRAVKLASSLPSDNILGQALFAHALLKSGQTGKALLVLRSLFQSQELDYEIQRLTNTTSSSGAVSTTTSSLSTTDSSSKRKKSKKGKSKVEEPVAAAVLPERDLLDQLETPLVLSEGWDEVKDATKPVITDEVCSACCTLLHALVHLLHYCSTAYNNIALTHVHSFRYRLFWIPWLLL